MYKLSVKFSLLSFSLSPAPPNSPLPPSHPLSLLSTLLSFRLFILETQAYIVSRQIFPQGFFSSLKGGKSIKTCKKDHFRSKEYSESERQKIQLVVKCLLFLCCFAMNPSFPEALTCLPRIVSQRSPVLVLLRWNCSREHGTQRD